MNITTKPYAAAASIITESLRERLAEGAVLLLLSGGSASGVYQELANILDLELEPGQLVVGLVDERYDLNPDHADANDRLVRASGLVARLEELGAIYTPVLHGHPLAEEVAQYNYQLTQFIQHEQRQIIVVLGIGPDGHIAGILPDNNAALFKERFESESLVAGYANDSPFPQRITATFPLLRLASVAIVLVKDISKIPLIKRAANRSYPEPLNLLPATIIQEIANVIIAAPNEEES